VLDIPDGQGEFQVFEVGVRADGFEGRGEGFWGGICREGVEDAAVGGGAEGGAEVVEVGGVAGEEGDGEIAMGWGGEYAGYAGALVSLLVTLGD